MDTVHTETVRGFGVNIWRDYEYDITPDNEGREDAFLVAFHPDFSVEGTKERGAPIVSKRTAQVLAGIEDAEEDDMESVMHIGKRFRVFGLEAYIHSGVRLALQHSIEAGRFPDRRWDVSRVGLVLVSRKEFPKEKDAEKAASALVDEWNDHLEGNIYGYSVMLDGLRLESCGGWVGDPEKSGCLAEARKVAERLAKEKPAKQRTRDDELAEARRLAEKHGHKVVKA